MLRAHSVLSIFRPTKTGPAALAATIVLAAMTVTPGRAEPVGDTRLFSADAAEADWLLPGHDYGNRRYSPLDEVNVTTVKRLVPK